MVKFYKFFFLITIDSVKLIVMVTYPIRTGTVIWRHGDELNECHQLEKRWVGCTCGRGQGWLK